MSSLALLARDVGVSERTLRRAVAEGTLHGRRSSPRKLDLPVDEHQYVRRRWAIVSKLRSVLRTEHNVRVALLFGSTALGTDTAGSDVDLLVALRDGSFDRVVDLDTKLTAELGRRVDLVLLDDATAEPSLLAEVLDHGRVVVDRDDLASALRADAGRLNRWRQSIVRHLDDFPRQYAALEHAMAAFGDFDLQRFKRAFNTADDIDAYNQVQAVERALGRVQNFVADLAQAGVKLAELAIPAERRGSAAHQAFAALADAGVISRALCARLIRAQDARTTIEHGYLGTSAGNVHRAAQLIHDSAREFIQPFSAWIAPFLTDERST